MIRPAAGAWSSLPARWPDWSAPGGLCLVSAAGLALFLVPLRGVHLAQMSGLGLVSVLPVASLLGAGLLTLAFAAALALPRPYPAVLGAMLAAIVFCLDGVSAIIEAEPAQAGAYQAAGIAHYLSLTGHLAPGASAFRGWPGFFALIAFAEDVLGTRNLIPVLRLWPAVMSLLWLPPLFLMIRGMRASWQARWFAAFLFCAGNWVGLNYFSPESYGYLLYLLFLAIMLTWFRTVPGTLRPRARRARGERAAPAGGARGCCQGNCRVSRPARKQQADPAHAAHRDLRGRLASYPLAAFLLAAACVGLVLARRSVLTSMPVLLLVILAGWFAFAAAPYWPGRLLAGIRSLVSAGGGAVPGIAEDPASGHLYALEARLCSRWPWSAWRWRAGGSAGHVSSTTAACWYSPARPSWCSGSA